LETLAITITFGNTHAPVAYNNLLKIYASLAREFVHDPESVGRFPGVSGRTVLALGADGPVGGDKAVAAYFVSVRGGRSRSKGRRRATSTPSEASILSSERSEMTTGERQTTEAPTPS
jgi:hypothetical protein